MRQWKSYQVVARNRLQAAVAIGLASKLSSVLYQFVVPAVLLRHMSSTEFGSASAAASTALLGTSLVAGLPLGVGLLLADTAARSERREADMAISAAIWYGRRLGALVLLLGAASLIVWRDLGLGFMVAVICLAIWFLYYLAPAIRFGADEIPVTAASALLASIVAIPMVLGMGLLAAGPAVVLYIWAPLLVALIISWYAPAGSGPMLRRSALTKSGGSEFGNLRKLFCQSDVRWSSVMVVVGLASGAGTVAAVGRFGDPADATALLLLMQLTTMVASVALIVPSAATSNARMRFRDQGWGGAVRVMYGPSLVGLLVVVVAMSAIGLLARPLFQLWVSQPAPRPLLLWSVVVFGVAAASEGVLVEVWNSVAQTRAASFFVFLRLIIFLGGIGSVALGADTDVVILALPVAAVLSSTASSTYFWRLSKEASRPL